MTGVVTRAEAIALDRELARVRSRLAEVERERDEARAILELAKPWNRPCACVEESRTMCAMHGSRWLTAYFAARRFLEGEQA